ncbi:hypothetical protein B9Z65_4510 [Elsinoe australis]|uniref:Rhodopsin domain-containing protein n=1 Tax=Elsinoe australis TaxID=40998 RepID=A0A2P7Z2Z7_9PEZI|nr:hypothetical protein B9Z65_4510 [Elsinoe australis]
MADDRSQEVLALAIVFLTLSTITMATRIYVRVALIKAMGSDDWTMLGAYACFLSYLICQLGGVRYGTGRRIDDLEREDAQQALHYWFVCEVFYAPATTLLKVSVGLFLLRITVSKIQIWIIRIFIAGSLLFGTFYFFLIIFQCTPVSFWWDLNPDSQGKCINATAFAICAYIISALNTAADFVFAILPMFLVWNTSMNRKTRALVCSLLGLGSIAGVATIVRIPFLSTLNHYKGDFLWNTTEVAMLTTVEVGLGIAAACAATFRPLVQRWLGGSTRGATYVTSNHAGAVTGRSVKLRDLENGGLGGANVSKNGTYIATVTRGDSWSRMPDLIPSESKEVLTEERSVGRESDDTAS